LKKLTSALFTLSALIFACQSASAAIVVGGTRVIYDGSKKEASLSVRNPDNTPYLVQSIVDNLDGGPAKTPFIITPPLYRLDGGKENLMRIILADNLPQDKESMYWLHVKGIPSAPRDKNTLQVAIETSIKLIYRPQALKGVDVEKESSKLTFSKVGDRLQVKNSAPCFINFNDITVAGKKLENVSYVAPGGTASFALPAGVTGGAVSYTVISDFGATGKPHSASV
jgi:P pilus assembly chaperone PapD